jgi:regulator of CtrA degradation
MRDATIRDATDDNAIPFGRSFVTSDAFRAMFREGMLMVEDTAAYLDGPGREESRSLPRDVALAYATESMRLTTRLMQIASWLLVQRAVAEGEITPEQARTEKNRVRLSDMAPTSPPETFGLLPEKLRQQIDASLRMQARVMHLEAQVAAELGRAPARPAPQSGVASQLAQLRSAFGG